MKGESCPPRSRASLETPNWDRGCGGEDGWHGEGRKDGGGVFAASAKAEKCRLAVNVFTKVFVFSPGHTKSAWLGPPASAGYF